MVCSSLVGFGVWSLSARRAWIEMDVAAKTGLFTSIVALRKESVDRNIDTSTKSIEHPESLSARRAWIEITAHTARNTSIAVALRKESVDRNRVAKYRQTPLRVALRKESVDRNITRGQLPTPEPPSLSARRAWIEIHCSRGAYYISKSLSARRAWIEIYLPIELSRERGASLSARRAWIEITQKRHPLTKRSRSPQGERG